MCYDNDSNDDDNNDDNDNDIYENTDEHMANMAIKKNVIVILLITINYQNVTS